MTFCGRGSEHWNAVSFSDIFDLLLWDKTGLRCIHFLPGKSNIILYWSDEYSWLEYNPLLPEVVVTQMTRKHPIEHLKMVKEVVMQKQRRYGVNTRTVGAMIAIMQMSRHLNHVRNWLQYMAMTSVMKRVLHVLVEGGDMGNFPNKIFMLYVRDWVEVGKLYLISKWKWSNLWMMRFQYVLSWNWKIGVFRFYFLLFGCLSLWVLLACELFYDAVRISILINEAEVLIIYSDLCL